jgi:hypothetical protein
MVAVREACKSFIPTICDALDAAVERNAASMSNTRNAGISHDDISDAVCSVRAILMQGYEWDCVPGKWLIYTMLLALPFSAKFVCPDTEKPVWVRPPARRMKGVVPVPNLRGMPESVPQLPAEQYALPLAVGHLCDCTILSSDALRPLADAWCQLAMDNLLRAGSVVAPLRTKADILLDTRGVLATDDYDSDSLSAAASTSSSMSSLDSDSDSEQ